MFLFSLMRLGGKLGLEGFGFGVGGFFVFNLGGWGFFGFV